jgi:hypothetical protein
MSKELGEYLNSLIKKCEGKEFKPRAYYDEKADFLVYYHEDVQSYEKWLTPYLSLFLSMEDDRIIGFEVNGLKNIINGALK